MILDPGGGAGFGLGARGTSAYPFCARAQLHQKFMGLSCGAGVGSRCQRVATGQQGRQDKGQQGFSSYCNPLLYMVLFFRVRMNPTSGRFCEGWHLSTLPVEVGSPGDLLWETLAPCAYLGIIRSLFCELMQ